MGLDEKYKPILFIPKSHKNCEKPPVARKDLKDSVI